MCNLFGLAEPVEEISALASELKSWAKSHGKSAYVVDRRRPGLDPARTGCLPWSVDLP